MLLGLLKAAYQVNVNSIPVQIGVGMSSKDLRARIEKPFATTLYGTPLNLPNASGFVPDVENFKYANTFWMYGKVVYVFFDENVRIIAYYICTV